MKNICQLWKTISRILEGDFSSFQDIFPFEKQKDIVQKTEFL